MKRSMCIVFLIFLLLFIIILIQYYVDREGFARLRSGEKIRFSKVDEGVHILPSPKALKLLTVGFDAAVSEFLFIKSLNYFYQYKPDGKDSEYMNRLYNCLNEADPFYFLGYRHGGYFLKGPFDMQTDALRAFKKGTISLSRPSLKLSYRWKDENNRKTILERKDYTPRNLSARLMIEAGVQYFAYLKDNKKASEVFRYGQHVFPEYKDQFIENEEALRYESGQYQMVIQMWERFIKEHADNPDKVNFGMYKIKVYRTLHNKEKLARRIKERKEQKGTYPFSLLKIASPSECIDGFGDRMIYFRSTGKVYSRALIKSDIDQKMTAIRRKLKIWFREKGSYPESLEQINVGRIGNVVLPFEADFNYDSRAGTIQYPGGFGVDVPNLLITFVSAEYIRFSKNGSFRNRGYPRELIKDIGEDNRISKNLLYLIKKLDQYKTGFMPAPGPFAMFAYSPKQGTYIIRETGPVYYKQLNVAPFEWPDDLSEWEAVAR